MMVGERLKAIRKSKQLSQLHIEKMTGLLRCYVSRAENGYTVPSIETLEKWSRALEISLSQLFAENGEAAHPLPMLNSSAAPTLSRSAMHSLRRIEAAFAHMKPRDIALVTNMARKLADKRKASLN
jgi:transcriptional regulator with XRE-family HTH domain